MREELEMNELVSVVMSIYNERIDWIRLAVNSILEQTYTNIELIIVIDNPDVESNVINFLNEIKEKDQRLFYYINERNMGLALSLNRGISLSNGNYIARMDSDDISELNRIEKEMTLINEFSVDMVATGKICIDEEGIVVSSYTRCVKNSKYIKKILVNSNCINHPSVLIKKKVINTVGCYRNFRQSQDYDLWLRLVTNKCNIAIIDEPLIRYRIRSSSISKKKPYLQFITSKYQKRLYKMRKFLKKDDFSEENFEMYLDKYKARDTLMNEKYEVAINYINKGINDIKKKSLAGLWEIFRGIIKSPHMISILYGKIIYLLCLKQDSKKK